MARDAAEMKPRLIPDFELLGRDDSGGPDFQPYTAQFGDGGHVAGGDKKHLSVSGGKTDEQDGTEQVSTARARERFKGDAGPAKSAKQSREM
jgi:hypothetical protein